MSDNRIRVAVNGAAGRMGQRVVALTTQDPALALVAAVDSPKSPHLGLDAGEKAGVGKAGVPIRPSLETEADAVVDFSMPEGLLAIARAMGTAGHGTFQMVPFGAIGGVVSGNVDRAARQAEHDLIASLAEASGRPVTYLMLQIADDPDDWFRMLAETERHAASGLRIHPQIASRPGGLLATGAVVLVGLGAWIGARTLTAQTK